MPLSRRITITVKQLIDQLIKVGDVISAERGDDLVSQAISLGILQQQSALGVIELNHQHPVVDKTLIIVNRMVRRVANTLLSRNWEYVNYGFLLKGLAMERDLDRPGMNDSDQWRSHWIDCLVRERVLQRDLVPHRHNPDDLGAGHSLARGQRTPLGAECCRAVRAMNSHRRSGRACRRMRCTKPTPKWRAW